MHSFLLKYQGILGVMYLNAQGVVANVHKGFENLLEASSQGINTFNLVSVILGVTY